VRTDGAFHFVCDFARNAFGLVLGPHAASAETRTNLSGRRLGSLRTKSNAPAHDLDRFALRLNARRGGLPSEYSPLSWSVRIDNVAWRIAPPNTVC